MVRKRKSKTLKRFISFLCLVSCVAALCVGIAVYKVHQVIETNPLSQCGEKIPQRSFPITLISAVLAQEDHAFLSHQGINWREAKQALIYNLLSGRVAYGASTIDMQVASLCYIKKRNLNPWVEKLLEIIASKVLLTKYSKEEILRAYLTVVPLGPDIRGFNDAAKHYFEKNLMQLNYSEEWSLVLTLRSVDLLNPAKTKTAKNMPKKIHKQLVAAKWRQSQTLRWHKKKLMLLRFTRNKTHQTTA